MLLIIVPLVVTLVGIVCVTLCLDEDEPSGTL
jgi:hypothetical protein